MRLLKFGPWLLPVALLVGAGCDRGKDSAETVPTFAADIAPIVHQNCSYCHRPGQAAPFNLLTYADVNQRAKQIGEVTASRYMPPWLPAPGFNHIQNERLLTDEQIALIARWLAAGAPEGDPTQAPAPPEFEDEWMLGRPDLVVRMPDAFPLPADGPDVYRNFVIPIPVNETKHVRSMEFRPGNARVVHHAFIAVDPTEESHRTDANEEGPGFGGMHLPPSGAVPDGQFFSWQPGKVPMGGADSRAWRLETNSWLVLQLHLQTTGKPETVQAEVGFYFAPGPGTDLTFKLGLSSYALNIPAGATNFVAEDAFELPVNVELLGILPHAHYLARRMHGLATLPDGTSRWLLNIDRWDFNWQGEYWYREPIALPAGTRVGMRFFYDNSTNNPANPSTPPQPVTYGLYSTDEMAELWMIFRVRTEAEQLALNQAVLPKIATDVITYNLKALEKDPANANAWLRKGTAHHALGQLDEAFDSLTRALQFNPQLDEARYYRGLLAFDQQDYATARDEFSAAVEINNRNYKAHGYLGLVYLRLNDLPRAEASLMEALLANPGDEVARANLKLVNELKQGGGPP